MDDGIIKGTGNSRFLKSAISDDLTFEQFKSMLRAGTLPVDLFGINPSGWDVIGTALSKANLLTDETAEMFGLTGNDRTVESAFFSTATIFGNGEPTPSVFARIGQKYFDSQHDGWWGCVGYDDDGTVWKKIAPTNTDLFGTRGPYIISSTMTFNAATIGLMVGDRLNVICIGGGAGGGGGGGSDEGGSGDDGQPGGTSGGYGSGGSGGAGYNRGYDYGGSGGGGGSGYAAANTITLQSLTVPVTIGARGSGGRGGSGYRGSNGTNGGATSFGTYLSAAGGSYGHYGEPGSSEYSGGAGGAGGNSGSAGTNGGYGIHPQGGLGGAGYISSEYPNIVSSRSPTLGINGAVILWY